MEDFLSFDPELYAALKEFFGRLHIFKFLYLNLRTQIL